MKKQTKSDNSITATAVAKASGEQETKPVTYVVVRDGYRVSDKEYSDPTDEKALEERKFWRKVADGHSHGERVEIVQYQSKEHRVW